MDLIKCEKNFKNWAKSTQTDQNIDEFNPSSTHQLQQLLFAPFVRKNIEKKGRDLMRRMIEELDNTEENEGKEEKKVNKIHDAKDFPEERTFKVLNTLGSLKDGRKKPNKFCDMTIKGLVFLLWIILRLDYLPATLEC